MCSRRTSRQGPIRSVRTPAGPVFGLGPSRRRVNVTIFMQFLRSATFLCLSVYASASLIDSHHSFGLDRKLIFSSKLSQNSDLRGRSTCSTSSGGGRRLNPNRSNVLGLLACAASTSPSPVNDDEAKVARLRKFARSVDQVVGSAITGFCGPWVLGFIFGVIGGVRTSGLAVAARNAVGSGNSWGLLSASFCGVEALAREIRGKSDKWNNIMGACSAGVVSNCAAGPQAMATGCLNFAAMSYLLDLFMSRQKDAFEQYVEDPSKVDNKIQGMSRNVPKDKDTESPQ
jgi:hypothetical protein